MEVALGPGGDLDPVLVTVAKDHQLRLDCCLPYCHLIIISEPSGTPATAAEPPLRVSIGL